MRGAYFTVPLSAVRRRFLYFLFSGETPSNSFSCLPFGLCCAPRVFIYYAQACSGISARTEHPVRPLDDILILGTSQPECLNNTRQAISLLRRLGFILYEDKSQLSPSEQILFLGLIVDSVQMSLSLDLENVQNSQSLSGCPTDGVGDSS